MELSDLRVFEAVARLGSMNRAAAELHTVVADAWRDGRLELHELPRERAMVQTLLIQRKDAHVSSALSAFLSAAVVKPATAIAAE